MMEMLKIEDCANPHLIRGTIRSKIREIMGETPSSSLRSTALSPRRGKFRARRSSTSRGEHQATEAL